MASTMITLHFEFSFGFLQQETTAAVQANRYCCDRKPERQVREASHRGSKQQQRSWVVISLTTACSRYLYNGVIFHAHPVRGESHNQRNTTGEVATISVRALKLKT